MRAAVLVAVFALAGCAGESDSPADGPATLVVTFEQTGKLTTEALTVDGGRLKPGAPAVTRVYARAGDDEPDQGISFEEIYVTGPGRKAQRLTSDRRFDHSPSLLRDGRVAFVSCPLPSGAKLPNCSFDAVEPSSRKRRTIVPKLGFVWAAQLAPDERRLLLSRVDKTLTPDGLFVRELDSGSERRLGDGGFGRWSPDGERIAFVSDRDRNGPCVFHACIGFAAEIYVMDAAGGGVHRLTTNPTHDAVAAWSGDGEWVVFGRIADQEDDWDLWAVRADGKCELRLTDTTRSEIDAEWHGAGGGGLGC